VAAAGALVPILHLPAVQRWLAPVLERALSTAAGGAVTVASLEFNLWTGRVHGTDLRLVRPGLEITGASLDLHVRPWRGVVIRATEPRLVVSLTPAGTPAAPDLRPWTVLERVAALDVLRGAIRVQSDDGSHALQIEGLDVRATRDGGGLTAIAAIRALAVRREEYEWQGAVDAGITLDLPDTTRTVRVRSAEATVDGARVRLTGELQQLNPLIGRARVEVPAGMGLLRALVPDGAFEGELATRAEVVADRSGHRATVVAEATAVRLARVGPWDGRVAGHVEGGVLRVDDIDLVAYGGRLRGHGAVSLDGATSELRAIVRGIDLRRVLAAHANLTTRIASLADADVSLRMSRWDRRTLSAEGTVTFRPVTGPGIPLRGSTRFSADARRVRVSADTLRAHEADLRVHGTIGFDGGLGLRYGVRLADVSRLPAVLAGLGVAVPRLNVRGALAAAGTVDGTAGRWVATARVAGRRLAIEDLDLDVDAELRVTPASMRLVSLSAGGPDGALSASGDIPMRRADAWRIAGSLERLRLDDLLARRGVPLDASARGHFEVTGRRPEPEVAITFEADVSSRVAAARGTAAATVLVEAAARASSRGVVVDQVRARTGTGVVVGSGRWSSGGDVEARVRASEFPLAALPGVPLVPGLESMLSGDLEISGTRFAPKGRGSVSATRTVWRGAALPDVRVALSSDGREITLAGSTAQRPLLTGRLPLVAPWPLHLDIDLAGLPTAELMRAVPGLATRDASATLSGRGLVDLELASPSGIRYEARVEGAEGSFTQHWTAGPFSVRGTLDDVSVENLEMQFGVGRLRIDGQVGLAGEASGRLTIAGAAPLSHLAIVTPIEEAAGDALLDVTLTGSAVHPAVTGTVRVENGLIRWGTLRVEGLELVAAMDDRGVEIRHATAQVAGGRVHAKGALALPPRPSDVHRLDLHAMGIDLARLLPPRDNAVTVVVDGDLRVGFDDMSPDGVRAEGSLTRVAVSASGRTLGLDAPVALSVRSGTLTHAPLRLAGSAGHVTLASAVALVDGQAQLAVDVDGEVDLVVARPLLGDSGTLAGLARVHGRVERDAGGWHARGDARVDGGRLALADPEIVLDEVAATVRAEGQRIEVVEGSARVGDGGVSVTGRLLLSSEGADVDLVLRASRVPLEYPTGLRTRSSGDLRLTGRSGAYRLAGDVVVHRAVFEDEDARAAPGMDRVHAALAVFEGRGSLRDRTALDLRLRLDDGLRVATPQVSLVVDGTIGVGGTVLAPEIGGSFTFREGGTIRVSRALVRLDAGRVELSGYPARQPELEVRGTTRVSGVFIDVSLSGPLDDVRVDLSSRNRSDLGPGDLATLLLTGRTTSAVTSESGAIVAEELASSLGRVLNRQLGGFVLFDVSRDESLIPENTDSSPRMNIGIPLGDRLYVIYSNGLDTGSLRWIVDFRPGGDFRLRVISNEDGSEAVEVGHRFSFDVWSRRLRPPVARARQRIGRVVFVGASGREEEQLRSRLRLRPGGEFDYFRARDAARTAEAWFIGQGFLEADVDAHQEITADGSVDVTVHVVRGPLVRIAWRGDNPGRTLRQRVTAGWRSVLPREERAARLAREVRRALRGARHFAAAVTAAVTTEMSPAGEGTDEVRVTFDVARGPRGAGVDLRFEGNASVPDATLAAVLPPVNSAAFFALLEPEGSRRLAAALRVAYATEGFLDMRAGTPAESFGGAGERLRVTIPVVEGERALVVALQVPEEVQAGGATSPALALRKGAPFRLDAYTADRARLLAWLRDEGYPDARISSALEPGPGGLAVSFHADSGPRVTLGAVRAARDGRTRPSIIEKAVAVSPGEPIRASSLDDARQRLTDTRVFRSVDLRLAPVGGREHVRDVVVDVVERPDIGVEYSLRYTTAGQAQVGGAPSETEAGVQAGAGIELVNPFGGADRYRVSGLLGAERLLLTARYERATFFGRRLPTELFLYDDRSRLADAQGLAQRVRGATFDQTWSWRSALDGRRLHDRFRMQWGYTIKRIDYSDLTQTGATEGGVRAGPIHSLAGDTRDSVTDPRHGTMWSIGSEWALVGLGSDVNYLKTFGQVFVYVPVLPYLTWAQGVRVGVVPGDNPLLLLDNRFFAGGASSVRGFAERSLGPRTPEGEAIGGQASVIVNQELRFPLWKRLHGAVFYDAGNAFALARDLDLLDLRQSAGAGLRLMFPFGPVRLDWAHVIGRRDGEKPSRFVFSIGHAF
jgi:outer membrane protein assembly factor BamA